MNRRMRVWFVTVGLVATGNATGDDVSEVEAVANLMSLLDHARDEGGSLRLVTTRLAPIGDGTPAEFEIVESELPTASTTVKLGRYFGPAIEVRDRALAVVVGDEVLLLGVLGDDGELIGSEATLHLIGTAGADFAVQVARAPISCIERAATTQDTVEAAIQAYLEGTTPLQRQRALDDQLDDWERQAAEIAGAAEPTFDEGLGEMLPNDVDSVFRQLQRGASSDDIVVRPLIPVYLRTSSLSSPRTIVLVDEVDSAVLGRLRLSPGDDSGYGTSSIESWMPIPRGPVSVYELDTVGLGVCASEADLLELTLERGTLLGEVSLPDFAGDIGKTWLSLDVADGSYVVLDTENLATVRPAA